MDRIDESPTEDNPEPSQVGNDQTDTFDQALSFIREHPTLIATLALSFVVVLKLMLVARGSLTTAEALLTSAGPVTIGLGILLTLFPTLLFIITFNSVLAWIDLLRDTATFGYWHLIAFWVLVIDVYFLSLNQLLVIAVAVLLFLGMAWIFERKRRRDPDYKKRPFVSDAVTLILVMMSVFVQDNSLWLPAERIVHGDPSSVIVGYVIQTDPDWTAVVRESDRHVLRLPTSNIHQRELCRIDGDTNRIRILGTSTKPPDYPLCSASGQDD